MPELVDKKDKKTGGRKPLSSHDAFMVRGIQSACHGKFFTMEYALVAEAMVDGCFCGCAHSMPHIRMPISILPIVNPDCLGFKPPHNWEPKHLGKFTPEFDHCDSD